MNQRTEPRKAEETPKKLRLLCQSQRSTYQVVLANHLAPPASLFLSRTSELTAHLTAEEAELSVEEGVVTIDGSESSVPHGPTPLAISAADGDLVDFDLEDSNTTSIAAISFHADKAGMVLIDGHDLVPGWITRHTGLVYFVLGVTATILGVIVTLLIRPRYLRCRPR